MKQLKHINYLGKNIFVLCVFVVAIAYTLNPKPSFAAAGINQTITLQGKVTNTDGTNVTDGAYDFSFQVYNGAGSGATSLFTENWTNSALFSSTMTSAPNANGESLVYGSNTNEATLKVGQILWNTTKQESVTITSVDTSANTIGISPTFQAWNTSDTITNRIYVKDGIFRVALNSLNQNWGTVDFGDDSIFVGVNFNADGEMKPRIRFSSAPYAMTASNSLNLGGISSTGYLRSNTDDTFESGHTLTVAGDIDMNGNVSIADTDITLDGATTNLTATGDFSINTDDFFINKSTGNVAIGSTNPGTAKLHVTGDLVATGALSVGGTTTFNSQTYTWPGSQTAGYVLQTNGTGTLSWADPAALAGATNYWQMNAEQISPKNALWNDLMIGGTSTASATIAMQAHTGNITTAGDVAINGGDLTSTGALTITPNAGSNLNIALSGTGDFAVNTNQLYVDTSSGNVGIGTNSPSEKLDVEGNVDFNRYKAIAMACDNGSTLPSSPVVGQWFLHTPTGRKVLMQYSGTVWVPILNLGSTSVYVDPSGTDSQDNGYGTGTNAYKTINYAYSQIGAQFSGGVGIYVAAGTYDEAIILGGKLATGNFGININGTLTSLDSGTVTSGVMGTGATRTTITDTSKSWTTDQFKGKLVDVNSAKRVIISNTSDTLTLAGVINGVTPSGAYTIYDYGTILTKTTGNITSSLASPTSHYFSYIKFDYNSPSSIMFSGSNWTSSVQYSWIHNAGVGAVVIQGSNITTTWQYNYIDITNTGYLTNFQGISTMYVSGNFAESTYGTKYNSGFNTKTGTSIYLNANGNTFKNFGTLFNIDVGAYLYSSATAALGYTFITDSGTGINLKTGGWYSDDNTIQYSGNTTNIATPWSIGELTIQPKRNTNNLNIKLMSGQTAYPTIWTDSSANTLALINTNGGAVFNERGLDTDVRIEGDTDVNLFFTDGSTDRVGIGTSSPGEKLTVATGNGAFYTSDTTGGAYIGSSANGSEIKLNGQGSHHVSLLNSAGNLQIGTADGGTTLGQTVTPFITMLGSNGNVGIGDTTPSYKLDVNGDINTTGAYRINGSDVSQYFITSAGTANQVWTSDGTGAGTWTDPSTLVSNHDYLQLNNTNVLSPTNLSYDLTLGGTSTAAAKISLTSTGNITATGAITANTDETINGIDINAGTISDATWNGSIVSTLYGGTGANLSSVAQYSIPYFSSNGIMGGAVAPGTVGYVLSTNGAGGAPSWVSADSIAPFQWRLVNEQLSPTNASTYDVMIGGTSTSSATISLQAATGAVTANKLYIRDTNASNTLNLNWNDNDTANRTLNIAMGGGDRYLTMNRSLTVGGSQDGNLTYNAAATLTVEGTTNVNQDLTTDADPTFAGLNADAINVGITGTNVIDTDSGNLVLGTTTDVGSSTTGLRIDTDGGLVDIDDAAVSVGENLDVTGSVRLGAAGSNNLLHTTAAGGAPIGNLYWGNRTVMDSNNLSSNAVTSLTSGDGVVGTATQGSVEIDVDLLTTTDGTGLTSSYSGLEFGGASSDKLALLQGCNDGETLKYTDSNGWACASDNNTGSSYTFTNGLSEAAGTVKFGGNLTESTTITQDSAESLTFTNAGTANTIFNLTSTGDFDIQDNGTSAFFVRDDGNVGIGTNAPGYKLSVTGDINISSGQAYRINGTDVSQYFITSAGSSGDVWKSDGTGAGTWGSDVGFANPMTTAGDLIYGGTAGAPTRLAGAGTDNFVLKYDTDTNTPYWGTDNGGTTYTASNGITLATADFQLGGALTQNTTITQDTAEVLSFVNAGTANTIFNLSSTGDMVIQDNGTPFVTFTDSGTMIVDSLTLDGTGITSSGALGLSSAAGSDITLTSHGNAFTLPTTTGSNGYLLSTNGSGSLSWTDPASLGGSGVNYWNFTGQQLSPTNLALDLMLGGTATASAPIALQANTGAATVNALYIRDSNASNTLHLNWNENDTANRTLNLMLGNGDRYLTLNEDFTIGNGFAGTLTYAANTSLTVEALSAINQDVTTDASPTFAGGTLGNITVGLTDDNVLGTSTGPLNITPAAGSNVNINLSGTGDFTVNNDDLYVDTSTGFVGIGTATPSAQLDIAGTTSTITNTSGDITIDAASNNISFAGDSLININNALVGGSVGINTVSPTQILDVNGNARIRGSLTLDPMSSSTVTDEGTVYYDSDTDHLYVRTGDSAFHRVALDLTQYTVNNASVANGSYVEIAHNQNTNDLSLVGWVKNTLTGLWEKITDKSVTVKQALQNEFDSAAASGKIRVSTVGGYNGSSIQLNQAADLGNGADGAITVSANGSINAFPSLISGRSCSDGGDAVNYSVTALTSTTATLSTSPSAGCLSVGDEVLLINLQGTSSYSGNVGNYETLRVANVSTNTVAFTTAKTKYYGNSTDIDDSNIGTATTNQRVMLQRVPNYTNVTVNTGVNFYPDAWNGIKGGVMFFRATGSVNIVGTVRATGMGYRYGAGGGTGATGTGGEAFCANPGGGAGAGGSGVCGGGAGASAYTSSAAGAGSASLGGAGGPGGSAGNGSDTTHGGGGGGGGYGTAAAGGSSGSGAGSSGGTNSSGNGGSATVYYGGGGGGGGTYGNASLDKLMFGSGGGGGGGTRSSGVGGAGGSGGGIIAISANSISVTGTLASNGNNASAPGTYGGGGGGGAGGSIKLSGSTIDMGSGGVTSNGGSGSVVSGRAGATGGSGRIAVFYSSNYSGASSPGATVTQSTYFPYGLYHSGVISTPNATSLNDLRWESTNTAYGKVAFQTRTGNTPDPSGVMWTKYNNDIPTASDTTGANGRIPLGTSGKGDSTHAIGGSVILDNGTYKMWYTGYDGTNYRTYYATSPDGLTWTKYNNAIPTASDTTGTDGRIPLGTSGKGDSTWAGFPTVIKDGSTYKMWYAGNNGTVINIYYATSPDGLTWTKYDNTIPTASDTTSTNGRIPIGTSGRGDATYAYYPSVILDGSTYKMWYSGYNGTNIQVFYATSPDGLTWTKYNNAIETASDTTGTSGRIPVGTAGKGDSKYAYGTSVIKDTDGTYQMWYTGYDETNHRIHYATSSDGLTWAKYDNTIPGTSDTTNTNGRVPLGTAGKGDATRTAVPAVILDNGVYKMWYAGHDGTNYRIYSATNTPDNSSWEAWKPMDENTNYVTLQSANTHTDWTGTNATVADGSITRNVDFFEDEDESTAGNTTQFTNTKHLDANYIEATITSTDISNYDYLTAWVYASASGNTVKLGFGESAATEQEETVTIDATNTWQKVYWDLSDVTSESRNAVTKLRITNLNNPWNTIHIDNIRAEKAMTVSSGTQIKSTPNNYFQYRAIVTTTNTSYQPKVNNIQFTYNDGYKIVQTDVNTVRLYNSSGQTQELRLDAIVYGADLAEYYSVEDQSIGPGDVVALTGFIDDYSVPVLRKATSKSGSNTAGIISTKAGVTLGLESTERRLLGLAGRVPVKVASDSAKISAGDFLAPSDVPGMARPAKWGDMIIGKALEPWFPDSDKSTVLTLINDPSPYYPVLTRTLDQVSTIVEGATYMAKAVIDNVTVTNNLTSVSIDTDKFSTNIASISGHLTVNTATVSGLVAGTINVATLSAQTIISPSIDTLRTTDYELRTDISTLSARISVLESQAKPSPVPDYSYLDTMIASLSARFTNHEPRTTNHELTDLVATESALLARLSSLDDGVASDSSTLTQDLGLMTQDLNLDVESVMVSDFLSVIGESVFTNVAINGSLAIGNWNIIATESQLSIGDLLTLDSTGNLVTITGNLKVTGLADLNQLTSVDATISGTLTVDTIYNKQLEQLASQSANLAAQVASLSAVLGVASPGAALYPAFDPTSFAKPGAALYPAPTPVATQHSTLKTQDSPTLPMPLEEFLSTQPSP